MIKNQYSNFTRYDRYPLIFKEVSTIKSNPKRVLSFGCSTGLECDALSEIYYPDTEIIGLDIDCEIISFNKQNNNNKNIKYFCNIEEINCGFDLVFAMSVLCRGRELENIYTFYDFSKTLDYIDNLIEKNGYICIYNSKYLFTDTQLYKQKYKIINTKYKETGFVAKYNKDNKKYYFPQKVYSYNKVSYNYPYYLFQKII